MSHLKRFEIVSFEGCFYPIFGHLLLSTLGHLTELNQVKIGFGWISESQMTSLIHAGCANWDNTRLVSLTLVPKGQQWTLEEMDRLRQEAYLVGAHLEFGK